MQMLKRQFFRPESKQAKIIHVVTSETISTQYSFRTFKYDRSVRTLSSIQTSVEKSQQTCRKTRVARHLEKPTSDPIPHLQKPHIHALPPWHSRHKTNQCTNHPRKRVKSRFSWGKKPTQPLQPISQPHAANTSPIVDSCVVVVELAYNTLDFLFLMTSHHHKRSFSYMIQTGAKKGTKKPA